MTRRAGIRTAWTAVIAVAFVSAIAVRCLAPHGDAGPRPTWRVLLYMSADNDLEPAAVVNLSEVRAAPAGLPVALAIQVDRSRRHSRADGDWAGTRRFIRDPGRAGLRQVADLGDLNAAAPETLRDFVRWGRAEVVADRTLLLLWGHGQGDREILEDEAAGGALAPDALGWILDDRPIDVLGLDLCSGQMLEIAQTLATSARFVVGSESPRHALGWPYPALLAFLAAAPDTSPRELAVWLADHAGDRGGEFTGSALDLAHVGALQAAVEDTLRITAGCAADDRAAAGRALAALPWMSRTARSVDLGQALAAFAPYAPASVARARDAYGRLVARLAGSAAFHDATGLAVYRPALFAAAGLPARRRQAARAGDSANP